MSSPPPTKPPRGVKQGKETSGLLMSVIRTLSASETNEQREKERAKLEKEYKKSDVRLDELVAAHAQEIVDVMQKFTLISSALGGWGEHVAGARARLGSCARLLQVRRGELRRLWAAARAHALALQMMSDISSVVQAERSARELEAAGRSLAAAHTLRDALSLSHGSLAHVDALASTRHHLEMKKLELVDSILKRLSEAVYGSEREPIGGRVNARRRTALLLAELTKSSDVTDAYLQDVSPEFEASLSDDDVTLETTAAISLEALGVLGQLEAATEKFKVQIQNELLGVIDAVSRRIIDEADVEPDAECEEDGDSIDMEGVSETSRPFARLMTCLCEEFRACGERNKRLLALWRGALVRHGVTCGVLHSELQYWSAVQQVLQLLLTEYLDIESVQSASRRTSGAGTTPRVELPLADYFAKKRPQRRTGKLFHWTATAPLAERGGQRARADAPRVCPAAPALLHAALPALCGLCAHLEPRLGVSECSLRAFLSDYIRTGEAARLASGACADIRAAYSAPGAWRQRQAPPDKNNSEGHRSVYTCCVTAWQVTWRVAQAARRCGACGAGHAARAVCVALGAAAAPRAPPDTRAHRWLADDDIVRFLKSLPNWKIAIGTENGEKLNQQELNQAYDREAEILGSSLGDGTVQRREIISDVNTLVEIAVMCESMDWLSCRARGLPAVLPGAATELTAAAAALADLSQKCLLVLHLELRIQCFHYLSQGAEGAASLARSLLAFHEHAHAVLAPRRLAYVLSGLGEMMSLGALWLDVECVSAGHSLAALRHCLAALRQPGRGLQRAAHCLRLRGLTPQEIIAEVREKGAQFSELEYLNIFKSIGERLNIPPGDMREHLQHLSSALGHVGVTV